MALPLTLLLHTSTPTARIGLADGNRFVAYDEFLGDRSLAETLAERIRRFLQATSYPSRLGRAETDQLPALQEVVVHAGPGGFSSLRIGVTTANAFAYALGIPVTGVSGNVDTLEDLFARAASMGPAKGNLVLPVYAREPNIGPIPRSP